MCVCVCELLIRAQLFAIPWTVAHQAPLSMRTLQARVLEWVAISFSRLSSVRERQNHVSVQFSSVQSFSRVQLFAIPWIAAHQASLSINSRSSLRLTSIESMMPSSHLILCRPRLLPPQCLPASVSFQMSQLILGKKNLLNTRPLFLLTCCFWLC